MGSGGTETHVQFYPVFCGFLIIISAKYYLAHLENHSLIVFPTKGCCENEIRSRTSVEEPEVCAPYVLV